MGPKPRTPRTSSAASESTVSKASSSGTPTRRTRMKTSMFKNICKKLILSVFQLTK